MPAIRCTPPRGQSVSRAIPRDAARRADGSDGAANDGGSSEFASERGGQCNAGRGDQWSAAALGELAEPVGRARPASDGIAQERALLAPLRQWSNRLIDTTNMTSQELTQKIRTIFAYDGLGKSVLTIASFGFARGIPRDATCRLAHQRSRRSACARH